MKPDSPSTPPAAASAGTPPAPTAARAPATHSPVYPHALSGKPAFHAFDPALRFGHLQPRHFASKANAARVAREHTRGRHFG